MATEQRPVPRPRRTMGATPNVTLVDDNTEDAVNGNTAYENVTLMQIGAKVAERSSSSSSSSPSLGPVSISSTSSSSGCSMDDEVDNINNNVGNSVDVRNPYSNILMQIDQIKLSEEKVEKEEKKSMKSDLVEDNKPKPAPRNRTKQTQQQPMLYENTEIKRRPREQQEEDQQNNNNSVVSNPEIVISASTGAIKKTPNRTAPPRPPSPVFRNRTPEMGKKAQEATVVVGGGEEKMTRSSSINTLDSSQDGSEASSSKFKTSSPGQVIV